jgi:hypothetical protein
MQILEPQPQQRGDQGANVFGFVEGRYDDDRFHLRDYTMVKVAEQ